MQVLLTVVLALVSTFPNATGADLDTIPSSVLNTFINNLLRLERSVTKMESELASTKTEVTSSLKTTEAEIENLTKNHESLEGLVRKKESALEATKTDVTSLKTSFKRTNKEMMTRIDSLQAVSHNLTKTLVGRRAAVSFQVQQVKSPLTLSDKEVLKFDAVTLNTDNAYNKNSGIFTAPVTGTYLFWANIMSYRAGHYYTITLLREGKELTRSHPGVKVDDGVATISYLAMLTEGDHVWFALEQHGPTVVLYGDKYSNYGGTLL